MHYVYVTVFLAVTVSAVSFSPPFFSVVFTAQRYHTPRFTKPRCRLNHLALSVQCIFWQTELGPRNLLYFIFFAVVVVVVAALSVFLCEKKPEDRLRPRMAKDRLNSLTDRFSSGMMDRFRSQSRCEDSPSY